MGNVILAIILILVIAAAVIAILARFYMRTTREIALIRTGFGGRRVVMDGGAFAIPWFNEVARVNMQTLPLHISATGDRSIITKDKLRVDARADFYMTVEPTDDGVALAQQTLGNRTFDPAKLSEFIGGKLIDALRAVAAGFTMDELHENRGRFVASVREMLIEPLSRNGLLLDSVSLTELDQTPFDRLDENNAFNAVGMRKLAEVIATSKKERAQIDADSEVSVRQAAVTASKQRLDIDLQEEEAKIMQTQQIEALKAAQIAEVVKHKTESELYAATARIKMEKEIRAADLAREQAIEAAEILSAQEIELARQARDIAIAEKSQEESLARSAAEVARSEVIKATEASKTVREMAEAERNKQIAIIQANEQAEVAGTRLKLTAVAEREATESRVQTQVAQAQADAKAMEIRSAADKTSRLATAESERASILAQNEIKPHVVAMKLDLARLDSLPKVVSEMVKPAERIDSIKIAQVSGLGPQQPSTSSGSGEPAPAYNQALNAIMDLAVQLPGLKSLGEELSDSIGDALGKKDAET
ncbi:MAG: flotillin family protein [Burkholderiaceae bacterium]